jgi:hypothetical protein
LTAFRATFPSSSIAGTPTRGCYQTRNVPPFAFPAFTGCISGSPGRVEVSKLTRRRILPLRAVIAHLKGHF